MNKEEALDLLGEVISDLDEIAYHLSIEDELEEIFTKLGMVYKNLEE